MAYGIKGQEYAIYYYFDVELPADAPRKISQAFNIADEVIRYLLVAKDAKKEKYEARRQEAAEQGEDTSVETEDKSADKDNKEE